MVQVLDRRASLNVLRLHVLGRVHSAVVEQRVAVERASIFLLEDARDDLVRGFFGFTDAASVLGMSLMPQVLRNDCWKLAR